MRKWHTLIRQQHLLSGLFVFLVGPFFGVSLPSVLHGNETQTVKQIEARYKEVHTFSAQFSQFVQRAAFPDAVSASGHIYYQGKNIHIQYSQPDRQDYIILDQHLFWVQHAERQVIEAKLDEAIKSRAPAALLRDVDQLSTFFQVANEEKVGSDKVLLDLKPRAHDPQISAIQMLYDQQARSIVGLSVQDILGTVSAMEFSKVAFNGTLPPDVFQAAVPPQYDRLTAPQ